jgi:hypothetical protein
MLQLPRKVFGKEHPDTIRLMNNLQNRIFETLAVAALCS